MNGDHFPPSSNGDWQGDFKSLYQTFAAASDLHAVSRQILDMAAYLTGAENCSLMLLDGRGELYVLDARGLDQGAIRSFRSRIGEGIAGQVAAEGAPLMVADIASDQRFSVRRRDKYRTGSFIACPITARDKVIGVLNVNDKTSGDAFNETDLDQAEAIARLAATALRSFLSDSRRHWNDPELGELYNRFLEAERANREFISRLTHDVRTSLNNIKGAVYYLQGPSRTASRHDEDFYRIIETEVDFLLTYFDEGMKKLEVEHSRLFMQGTPGKNFS